jgi:hypothetical protein
MSNNQISAIMAFIFLLAFVAALFLGAAITVHAESNQLELRAYPGIDEPIPWWNEALTPFKLCRTKVQICDSKFRTSSERKTTAAMKLRVFTRYGITPSGDYEIDHGISLTDGGCDLSEVEDPVTVAWPQPYAHLVEKGKVVSRGYKLPNGNYGKFGARQKDVAERAIHNALCAGKLKFDYKDIREAFEHWPSIYLAVEAGSKGGIPWASY